ncbi:hypothetical protein HDV01_000089 [Terramyces sp. JEL0728]|nr:hypothetical protein HDV01_000089 [Terramyces sp. JEL0728]
MIRQYFTKRTLDSTKLFICSGSLVLLFLGNIAEISYIEGPSMIPTANSGDLLLWDKISALWKPYKIGELVVFRSPVDKNRVVLKRILGLPGDTIYVDPTKSNERIIIASYLEKQDGQERKLVEMEQRMEEYFNQLDYKIDAMIKRQSDVQPEEPITITPIAIAAETVKAPAPPPPPPPPMIIADNSLKIVKSKKPFPKQEVGMGTVLQELSSRSTELRRSNRISQSPNKEQTLRPLLKKTNIPLSPGGTIHLPKRKSESSSTLRRQFRKAYDLQDENDD